MRPFTQGEYRRILAQSDEATKAAFRFQLDNLGNIKRLELPMTIDEIRVAELHLPPHVDTLMGVEPSRGNVFLDAPNEDRPGDEQLPDGYLEKLNGYLISIGHPPEPIK